MRWLGHVACMGYKKRIRVCDYSVELPHWSNCSWFDVCWSFGVVGLGWYPCCRLKHNCNTDTTPTQPHRNSNTHRNKNNTTNVVIQQNSRKLLMMDILMSETCWVHKKWNKIASDIKLVFHSSTGSGVRTSCTAVLINLTLSLAANVRSWRCI